MINEKRDDHDSLSLIKQNLSTDERQSEVITSILFGKHYRGTSDFSMKNV